MRSRASKLGVDSRLGRPGGLSTQKVLAAAVGKAWPASLIVRDAHRCEPPWTVAELFYSTQRRVMQAVSARLATPGTVLDIGCGTGRLIAHLQRARPGMRVIGLEPSARCAAVCGRRTNVDVVRAMAEALPHEDGSFDAVMSSMSFHRWADKPRALREAARVLRPGGVLALADISPDDLTEHPFLRNLLRPFTFDTPPLADRHRWLESAGLRLLYVVPTIMEQNVFLTVAERSLA